MTPPLAPTRLPAAADRIPPAAPRLEIVSVLLLLLVAARCGATSPAQVEVSPDGWVQDGPRESFRRGAVPYALVPDWTATRVRACGGLAWGDADHDGDQDLAVGTYFASMWPPIVDYYNYIYLNNGGTFADPPGWISQDQKHTAAAFFANLNGDAYPDLLFGNGGSSYHPSQIYYGQNGLLPTTPGWQSASVAWLTDAAPADFDLDGDVDVATANEGNSSDPYKPTYVFRNLGAGLETYPSWASSQIGITDACDWGDMDGDGRPELAVSGWVNWQTGVFRNLGTTLETTFAWTNGHPERTNKGIGWSDVDGDGDEDVATAHFSTGHVRIHLNNGGVLSSVADWQYDDASSATALAFGDLNGDHLPDLAVGVANGPVKVFLNTGSPEAAPEVAADLPSTGLSLRAGPNPCRDRVELRLATGRALSALTLEAVDVTGRVVGSLGRGIRGVGPTAARMATVTGRASSATSDLPRGESFWVWTPPPGSYAQSGVVFFRAAGRDAEGRRWIAGARVV